MRSWIDMEPLGEAPSTADAPMLAALTPLALVNATGLSIVLWWCIGAIILHALQ